MRLDMVFEKVKGPQDFTRENVLHTVAMHITCDDQVFLRLIIINLLADATLTSLWLWRARRASRTASSPCDQRLPTLIFLRHMMYVCTFTMNLSSCLKSSELTSKYVLIVCKFF
jgi:hypothetical protein